MDGWISVGTKPPEIGERVIVWFGEWVAGQRETIMHRAWSDGRFYEDSGLGYGMQPTHWMPLPPPPEG